MKKGNILGVLAGTVIGGVSSAPLLKNKFQGEAEALRSQLYVCDRRSSELERQLEARSAEMDAMRSKLAAATTEIDSLKAQLATFGQPVEPDNLKKIEGIGPKYMQVLNAAGVMTFSQLSTYSADSLSQIIQDAGVGGVPSVESWAEQAKLAASDQWEALDKLQDALKGGRRA